MTEPNDEGTAEFSFADLRAETAESFPQSSPKPDHTRSREPRSTRARRALGREKGAKSSESNARSTRQQTKTKRTIPNKKGQFVEPLTSMYAMLGMGLMPFDPVCAQAVITASENCAKSLDELAQKNDAIRRALWTLVQVSTMGAVITAHMPIILAIVMHHVPAARNMFGEMGAQMMQAMAQQAADQQAAQREADDETDVRYDAPGTGVTIVDAEIVDEQAA